LRPQARNVYFFDIDKDGKLRIFREGETGSWKIVLLGQRSLRFVEISTEDLGKLKSFLRSLSE
jgi:hypothetical protein